MNRLALCLSFGLAAPSVGAEAALTATAPPASIWLDAFRNGESFGYHAVAFTQDEEGRLIADTTVRFRVKAGPIPVYRYELNGRGVWRDDGLERFVSMGRKGDASAGVRMERVAEGWRVGGTVVTAEDLVPATHWNKASLEASRMVDAETGEIVPVTVTHMGATTLEAGGRSVTAEGYAVDGAIDYLVLFDGDRWSGLEFTLDGDRFTFLPGTPRKDILLDD